MSSNVMLLKLMVKDHSQRLYAEAQNERIAKAAKAPKTHAK